MSIEALNWAFNQPIKPTSLKFVLVAMCDYASENLEAFPSIETLAKKTSQNRKTVVSNLKKLRELRAIEDTGYRRGSTNQVIVYRLNIKIELTQNRNSTESGTVPETDINQPKNGTGKEAQNRDTEPPVFNHQLIPPVNTSEATGNLTVIPSDEVEVKKSKNQIPYSAIVDLYHELLPELRGIEKLNETRKRYIKNLFLDDLPDKQHWTNFFNYVRESDFLMGRAFSQDRRPFSANLEWLTKPANFLKISEGQYHE